MAAAETEIDGEEQRQVQHRELREIDGHGSLQEESDNGGGGDGAAAELVHLDVRFSDSQIVSIVHGFSVLATPSAVFLVTSAAAVSFLSSKGCNDNKTITSSRRSRLAAGRNRISLNGFPALICVTVPTGRSRGKMRSMPLVTTLSPMFTTSSFATYFMVSRGSPTPPTGLCMRDSASMAPTPLSLSVSKSTCEVSRKDSMILPTTPSGVITP